MKLVYFNSDMGVNFGDQLNETIFRNLLPDFFDDDGKTQFIGIGSLLGLGFARLPFAQKIVFSSGYAYGPKPVIDDSYDVVCVRGPKTAKVLGLSPEKAIADGAYLITQVYEPPKKKKYKCSIMLHWHSLEFFDWRTICEEADIHFIDPRSDTDQVLDEIAQSELILAEAMHAGITADALRVPWVPIRCYPGVNKFKWEDFTQSVALKYKPHKVPAIYNLNEHLYTIIARKTRGLINPKIGAVRALTKLYIKSSNRGAIPKATQALRELSEHAEGIMSEESICSNRIERLVEALDSVKTKYAPIR